MHKTSNIQLVMDIFVTIVLALMNMINAFTVVITLTTSIHN